MYPAGHKNDIKGFEEMMLWGNPHQQPQAPKFTDRELLDWNESGSTLLFIQSISGKNFQTQGGKCRLKQTNIYS